MTLNGVMARILRYFAEFGRFGTDYVKVVGYTHGRSQLGYYIGPQKPRGMGIGEGVFHRSELPPLNTSDVNKATTSKAKAKATTLKAKTTYLKAKNTTTFQ